jgi:hypothetical protein
MNTNRISIFTIITMVFVLYFMTLSPAGATVENNKGNVNPNAQLVTLNSIAKPGQSKLPGGLGAVAPLAVQDTARIKQLLSNMPINFIENRGQVDKRVRYYAKGNGMTVWFTDTEIIFEMLRTKSSNAIMSKSKRPLNAHESENNEFEKQIIHMKLKGGNVSPVITGQDSRKSMVNYFTGNDPKKWRTNVPVYNEIYYKNVYAGIDLRFYTADNGQIEYDFIVHPGADPKAINVAFEGVDGMKVIDNGNLVIKTAFGEFVQKAPRIYQRVGDRQVEVKGGFWAKELNEDKHKAHEYGFTLAAYDRSMEIVIDPQIIFSKVLGGNYFSYTRISHMALDAGGNIYVTGRTIDNHFPVINPIQETLTAAGSDYPYDVFVSKLSKDGATLLFSTFFGGSGDDYVTGLSVDNSGNAYIAGYTNSTDFPLKNPIIASFAGESKGFVAKIDTTGSSLIYSTYLGGSQNDSISALTVDGSGNVYVVGGTDSSDFPILNALQPTINTAWNGFITKLGPLGATVFSTYFGGSGGASISAIALDTVGNIYVAGATMAGADFPPGGAQPLAIPGNPAGFVSKIDPAGQTIIYSTLMGGHTAYSIWGQADYARNEISKIVADSDGNVYVAGMTNTTDFPLKNPYRGALSGCYDNFIAKLDASGKSLVFSTYMGSDPQYCFDSDGRINSIVIDGSRNIYIGGITTATNLEMKKPLQTVDAASNLYNGFITVFDPTGSTLLFSTYVCDVLTVSVTALALDSNGDLFMAGYKDQGSWGSASAGLINKISLNCASFAPMVSPLFDSSGGDGIFQVTTEDNCSWSAISNHEWINIISGSSGTSDGTVIYAVSPNTSSSQRTGTISIAGQTFTVTQDGIKQYVLFISKSGTGSGMVKSSDGQINCGSGCSAVYNSGTVVTLTATPNSGSTFSGWSGGGCSGTGTCSFSMNAETSVTASFAPAACSYSIDSTSSSFGSNAGTDSVKVITQSGCKWSVTNGLSWVTITSGSSGTGSGTVKYSVAANTGSTSRSGSFTIAGQTFTITQDSIKQYALTASKSSTGSGTIRSADAKINCGSTCSASYSSGALVTLIAAPASGSTFTGWSGSGCSGTGTCSVIMNAASTVTAAFAPACSYSIGSSSASYGSDAGSDSVKVTTQSGCSWSVTNGLDWVTITSGSSGTGSGTVKYSVASNPNTSSRNGSMTIAGNSFTINQAANSGGPLGYAFCSNQNARCSFTGTKQVAFGAAGKFVYKSFSNGVDCNTTNFTDPNPGAAKACYTQNTTCAFAIEPTGKAFLAASDTGSIAIAASSSSCSRTAKSNVSWITISSGASGTGSGTVGYSVSANTGTSSRTGTITVAGKAFTVTQEGIKQYSLSVSKSGTGSGTVKSSDSKINCGSTCSATYNSGASVTLTATANSGSTFSGWSGGGCSGTGSCVVAMSSATAVNAIFSTTACTFSVAPMSKSFTDISGTGSAAITASSSSCAWTAASNAAWITVTSGSSGTGSGTTNYSIAANTGSNSRTGVLTIAGQTITISQNAPKQYTLTIAKAGSGAGTVTSSDSSINCGATCSASYNAGTSVTLTAAPNSGSALSGWSGGVCSGTGSCSIAMSSNSTVTATFAPCTLGISTTSNSFSDSGGSGNVAVTASLDNCAWSATSNAPWIIVTSGASGTGNGTVGYAVSANTSLSSRTGTITIAGQTFTVTQAGIPQYTLTVAKSGLGKGTVTSADGKISCGSACSAVYTKGATVALTATPDGSSTFAGWSGGCSGAGACALTVNADMNVSAAYVVTQYIQNITITSPTDGVVISKSSVTVSGAVTATSDDIGITVNGYPADIHNGNWVVNSVPLADGSNIITVTAKDTNNNTITKTVTITKTSAYGVQLNANVTSGAAPLTVYFVSRTSMPNAAQLYEMDFLGNGTFVSFGESFENVTYTYTSEGIYNPVLRVTDTSGNVYTDTISITVLSKTKLDTLLKQKWEGMKTALKQQDVEKALSYFIDQVKDNYRQMFEANKDRLPTVMDIFEQFNVVGISGATAQCQIYVRRNGKLYVYPGRMVKDENGIWKFLDF